MDPAVGLTQQGSPGFRPDERQRDALEQRRFARTVPADEDGPAGERAVWPFEVELEVSESLEILESDAFDVHGYFFACLTAMSITLVVSSPNCEITRTAILPEEGGGKGWEVWP